MAIVKLCNGIIAGLTADTKPTTYPDGTIFIDLQLGVYWSQISGVWTQITTSPVVGSTIPSPLVKKWGAWQATAQLIGYDGLWQLAAVSSIAGATATFSTVRDSTGLRTRFNTGTTQNSLAGARISASLLTERDLNPECHWKIQLGQTTDTRMVFGFTSGGAPVSATEPLPSLTGIVFIYDSSVDANWHIRQNQGTATSADVVTNVAAAGTTVKVFKLRAVNATPKFQYSYDGGAWTDIATTQIPAASTTMGWIWYIDNLTAANKTLDIFGAYHEQDG